MRKIFVFLLFFITYTNAVELQNNKNSYLNNNEISYLKNKKALNVYIQKDWVPYNTIEFPQAIMFLKQYILLIGKKLNININFIDKKSKKHIDIICAKQKNDNTYIYSKNKVIDISFSLVTTKEQKGVSLNKLNGKKLAVVKDSSQLKYLRKHYPQIRLIECESHLDTLKFVLRKKVFAAFGNYFVLNYLIEKNFISGLNNIPIKQNRFIQSTPLYLAFNKDDTILKNIIDKITNSIDKESTYLLKKKWLGIYNKQDIFFTKTEKEFIKNHTITVNTTTSWMPINFFDTKNKNIVGIGIDYWKLIAKKAGLKYIIVKADNFSEVLKNIENKTYDVNMATSRTLDKQIYSIFSDAYEKFPIAIATLKTKKFIINGVELEGKKVAVGKQYSTYFLLKNVYPKIDFVLTKNIKEALKLVQEGKVFAAVDTEPVLKYQIILNNFNNVHITGITGVDFNLQIMIRDDYKILQRIINKAIDAISNQERIDIYKKWMGLRNESKIDYEFIFQLSLFFLIIIFLLAFAYIRERKLQNRIKQLNANLEKKIKIAIEENKKQQIIMMQQSRLAQMGEIISMIAHQWRQPLNGLSIITQTIFFKYKKGILDDKAINEFEKYIKKQVKHMSETIDYFRDFFKPEKEKIDFCINSTIQDIINILKPVFERKHIKITFDSPKIINYHGYQNELGQSIMNILNNSKDAFLESKQENRSIKIELQDTENRILIILEDNAGGIKDEILPMIFDPYFSTKSKKNGTGLGLYMSKIVIEDHFKGQIIASNIKNGAKFTISLPKK